MSRDGVPSRLSGSAGRAVMRDEPSLLAQRTRTARPASSTDRAPVGRRSHVFTGVTLVLVAVDVLVYLGQLVRPDLVARFGDVALARSGGGLVGVAQGQWYRLFTGPFLHAGPLHLVTNMGVLVLVGPRVEAALGRGRFLVLYLLAAVGGSVVSFVLSPPGAYGIGASGAVFGLLGAFYVVERRRGGAARLVAGVVVVDLVLSFVLPLVDWRAHLGGLVTGAAVTAGFAHGPSGPGARLEQVAVCAVVVATLAGAVLLRVSALRG